MKRLNIKMLRDIKKNLSQFITIFLMVMIGVMAYSGIESYMDGMTETAEKFYSENNLQDLNVAGANFTNKDLDLIKNIENVKDAERKLSITGTTDNDKTLLLNFIESNNISKFYIIEGEQFDKSKSGVWLDNFYAIENNIKVGDTILVKYENMELHEKVLGLINVPDHLYDVRDESELYPNRKEFGFAYLSVNEISFQPIFNNVMIDVEDNNKIDDVKIAIEDKIENAKAIINIEDTASYVTYQGEIDEGKTYVGVFSGLFLFIAMLSVITTMTRVVKNQRVQIGTLKALGFSDRKIILHYIGYGFWISILASIIGLILGYYFIGNIFLGLEMAFFEIPNGHPVLNSQCYIVAVCVVLIVSLITYITGRKILKENPAETLRNKIPNVKAKSINITTKGIFKKLSFSSTWNLRDIIRNKMRTFMGIAGVVGCCMLIVCALGMLDSMNFFVKLQFETIYNFDYKLNIKENISEVDLDNLYKEYGIMTSESLGIEIKDSEGKRESNNIFVTDAENYVRFVDRSNNIIEKPTDDGIFVTYKLAETKGYKIGDEVTWHIYGDNTYYTSKIIGFNKDPQNQNLSATKKYIESLGLEYKPNALYTNKDLSNVKDINGIDTIQNIESLKDGMTGMLSMMKTMLILIIGVAVLLGSVIIYNLGILSYTEKQYQFATLKVLGFKNKKIKNIFIKQNNWIAVISIIIGLPLGNFLTDWLFKTAIEEHYDFGANILPQTYIISAIGTFIVSYVVSRFLARKIKNIDMVSSLKGNE
ncbi:MAG: FtsX-like permease family protein [Clostridia bacterium]|nr:FtsX-like permease family protein [Clostridia bacterium]